MDTGKYKSRLQSINAKKSGDMNEDPRRPVSARRNTAEVLLFSDSIAP